MSILTSGKVIAVLLIVMGIFVSLATLVGQVVDSDVPSLLFPVWSYIKAFFALASITTAIGFIINISGYLKNWFAANHDVDYDFNRLGKTLTIYIGIITSIIAAIEPLKAMLPAPYNEYISAALAIGAAIIVILDLTKSTIADLIIEAVS